MRGLKYTRAEPQSTDYLNSASESLIIFLHTQSHRLAGERVQALPSINQVCHVSNPQSPLQTNVWGDNTRGHCWFMDALFSLKLSFKQENKMQPVNCKVFSLLLMLGNVNRVHIRTKINLRNEAESLNRDELNSDSLDR